VSELRRELIECVNEMPDELLPEFLEYLKSISESPNDTESEL